MRPADIFCVTFNSVVAVVSFIAFLICPKCKEKWYYLISSAACTVVLIAYVAIVIK